MKHSLLPATSASKETTHPPTTKIIFPTLTKRGCAWATASPTNPSLGQSGVVEAFEKVYDDKDLIVSFDSINISFPNRTDIKPNKPWPHQDQDPEKPGFRCLQGLVNLLPNGPEDGGLIVCKGAHLLSEEFHRDFKEEEKIWSW